MVIRKLFEYINCSMIIYRKALKLQTRIKCNAVPCKKIECLKGVIMHHLKFISCWCCFFFCYLIKFARFSLFVFFNNFKKSCFRSLCLVKGIVFSKWSCLKHVFANLNLPYTVTSYRLELDVIKWKCFIMFMKQKEVNHVINQ